MDDAAALAEIRRAAQAALDAWPDARAAVLFGSRARGGHRPDSDWDIAFITGGDGDRPDVPPSGLFNHQDVGVHVNAIVLPERLIGRKACSVGHMAHAVAADGRTIAGTWHRPQQRDLHMDTEKYRSFIAGTLNMAGNSVNAMIEITEMPDEPNICKQADSFAVSSSGAAEFLAKAIMCRHAIGWEHSHDMKVLSGQLHEAGHKAMAKKILGLNGRTKKDHLALYHGIDAPGLVHAIGRLSATLDLLRDELTGSSAAFPDSPMRRKQRSAAASICTKLAERLRDSIQRDGPRPTLSPDCEWIQPLLEFRPVLAERLDVVASRLRGFEAEAEELETSGGDGRPSGP